MFKSSVGQCKSQLRNFAIREGDSLRLDAGDNQNCFWSVAPSDLTFSILRNMTDSSGALDSKFSPAYNLEGSILELKKAETRPVEGPHASSGIYILTCPDDECVTAAKVVVVKSGPTCSCTNDPDGHSTIFSVTILYSDTAKNDMYPAFNFTLKGKILKSDMPLPVREDAYLFRSTSEYKRPGKSLGLLKDVCVTVSFAEPADWPVRHLDKQAPDFTASCCFEQKCS